MDRTPNQRNLNVQKITEENDETDDIKPLSSIARIISLGEPLAELKWVLNDTFLVSITSSNTLLIFDSLLYAFTLGNISNIDFGLERSLKLNLGKILARLEKKDTSFKVKGGESPLNLNGL